MEHHQYVRKVTFKKMTAWQDLPPQTKAMAEILLEGLKLSTGRSEQELIDELSHKSGVHRVFIELLFARQYLPDLYILTTIALASGCDLYLLAKPVPNASAHDVSGAAAVKDHFCGYTVWIKNESDTKSACKRMLSLIYGESPNMITLSRLTQAAVDRAGGYELSRLKSVSATKLQAFWYGPESLSYAQYECLLAAACLYPRLCAQNSAQVIARGTNKSACRWQGRFWLR